MDRIKGVMDIMAREDDLKRDLMYLYKDLSAYLIGLLDGISYEGIDLIDRKQIVKRQLKIDNREGLIDKLWEDLLMDHTKAYEMIGSLSASINSGSARDLDQIGAIQPQLDGIFTSSSDKAVPY